MLLGNVGDGAAELAEGQHSRQPGALGQDGFPVSAPLEDVKAAVSGRDAEAIYSRDVDAPLDGKLQKADAAGEVGVIVVLAGAGVHRFAETAWHEED